MKLWLVECQAEGWTQTFSAVLHADVLHDGLCPPLVKLCQQWGKESLPPLTQSHWLALQKGLPANPWCYAETVGH